MRPFTESMRTEYPDLSTDSVLLDVGGLEGNWTLHMSLRYNCEIHCFEPIKEFFDYIAGRVAWPANVHVHNFGIGGRSGKETFRVQGALTGPSASGPAQEVKLIGIADLLRQPEFVHTQIAVMKLNAEGSEFPILEAVLNHGIAHRFDNIAVQWHPVVDDFLNRRNAISGRLAYTHKLTWQDPDWNTGHENWRLK